MGISSRMVPKNGLSAKDFIKAFMDKWGDQLQGVVIMGMHKNGDLIDGWSAEVHKNAMTWLGEIEQLKMDFWNTLSGKRAEILNRQ